MTKVILDTSVVIEVINCTPYVMAALAPYDELQFTVIGLGELYYGAYNSTQFAKHIAEAEAIRGKVNVLNGSFRTAELYGQIKANLRKAGKMIPENDIWIAAYALEYNQPLITLDKHFANVVGLELVQLKK